MTQGELDDVRLKEIGTTDMMSNTGIIYHVESITELQIIGLCSFAILQFFVEEVKTRDPIYMEVLLAALLLEHVYAYIAQHYRKYEISVRGVTDVNFVKRARIESFLKSIQTFYNCVVFGFTMNFLLRGGFEQF